MSGRLGHAGLIAKRAINPANLLFLSHFDGANNATSATEETGRTLSFADNAKLSTTSPKFGTAKLTLDGSGDYVSCVGTNDLRFFTGDFTIEAQIKTTASTERYIIDFYSSTQNTWQFGIKTGKLTWYQSVSGSGSYLFTGTITVNDGNWHHIAVCRISGVCYVFVDGVLDTTVSLTTNYNYTSGYLGIGAQVTTRNAAYDFPGDIDEVRILNIGLWSSGFTPPSAPY